jgi:hypothetical protein
VGTSVAMTLREASESRYVLWRGEDGWELVGGMVEEPSAAVELDEETAWRLFTKGLTPREARERARESGESSLLDPLFATVAVMG